MTDVYDAATRSRTMAAVKGRDTSPELRLRRAMHSKGLRHRVDVRALPGRPDLVYPRFRAAVFVHGCFWHRHPGCPRATTPATRTDYWLPKFERTRERDARALAELKALGWRAAVIWECALTPRQTPATAETLAAWLATESPALELP
ncbi:very short patch repair endonuclease [uncultured Albimonas sp.]|uniref:very short patch repair endonuclease n=1 Tax=uncultured Albimonas sp. TaxID=1331701 RepID=UPI0030EEA2E2